MLPRLSVWTTDVQSLLGSRGKFAGGGERGHNLLEVIIASMIFVTCLVFMLGLWRVYHSALTQSKNRLVAAGLARSVMEQRLASGYGSLTPILNIPQTQSFSSKSQIRGRPSQVTYTTTFLATQSATSSEFRRLVVTVDWEEDSGKKSLSYESCLFQTQ